MTARKSDARRSPRSSAEPRSAKFRAVTGDMRPGTGAASASAADRNRRVSIPRSRPARYSTSVNPPRASAPLPARVGACFHRVEGRASAKRPPPTSTNEIAALAFMELRPTKPVRRTGTSRIQPRSPVRPRPSPTHAQVAATALDSGQRPGSNGFIGNTIRDTDWAGTILGKDEIRNATGLGGARQRASVDQLFPEVRPHNG
jgi:hypothetical protein